MQQSDFELQRNNLLRQYRHRIRPMYEKYQADLAKGGERGDRAYETLRTEIKPHLEELFSEIELAKKESKLIESWRWGKTQWREKEQVKERK